MLTQLITSLACDTLSGKIPGQRHNAKLMGLGLWPGCREDQLCLQEPSL